ncbi:phosphatidylinositol glycan, class K [Angomonas deanei]|uniref:Peptidase C13 family, putative n=1 Tax=Angomonas deanei TaxID=59799 RepID=A0A7G2CQZ7_9TRYP|nr:phosphatidylinositol glycan, class K [Angomonas deanei]CAD2222246.1 Peptidase C13 family, putative [Angomonas deanei]|eukprot:EPY35434.1 phosphatidylinositol glycan, class K [Angomonas deanei]
MRRLSISSLVVCLLLLWCAPGISAATSAKRNNWAVIVGSSRFFFNYRHTADSLSLYHILKRNNFDDDHILLFLADSMACHPVNLFQGTVQPITGENVYGCDTEVDYSGDDVDVKRFVSVLQGRYQESTPPTRQLRSDENSNIIIYMSGHAAEQFFKFHDAEFLNAADIGETFSVMHSQRRYHKILFIPDTCHGIALCDHVTAPNVACLSSSSSTEESYASTVMEDLAVSSLSDYMRETLSVFNGTSCENKTAGRSIPPRIISTDEKNTEGYSFLHLPLYDLNHNPLRHRLVKNPSKPAHRPPVNDQNALKKWNAEEFFCSAPGSSAKVTIRHDLLD